MRWFWEQYAPGVSAKDPKASPLQLPELPSLPPTLVATAEYDVLRDEGIAYAKRLAEARVAVTHVHAEGMNHGFAASANEFPYLSQAKDLLRQVAGWIGGVK